MSGIVECWKCHNAQIGPDGKVVVVDGVMVPRTDGGFDYCRFDPHETDGGVCPRCGRARYEPVENSCAQDGHCSCTEEGYECCYCLSR